jgi:DNA polymerase-3 subunit delta
MVVMITTLTGPNSYGLKLELKLLTDKFVGQYGDLSLQVIDVSDSDIATAREALTSLPFLSLRKLVVLKNPSSSKPLNEELEDLIKSLPETTDLIIVESNIDKRLAVYKMLKKQTDFKEFLVLDQSATISWLTKLAKDLDAEISSIDARYLSDRIGLDQERLFNELSKLALYDPKITRASIDLMTEDSPQSTIFELLEAAFAGNKRRVLQLYNEQRQQNVEPQQITSMLTWQLHILAVVLAAKDKSSDQVAKEAGLNPYVVRKSQASARMLSLGQVSRLTNDLLEIDKKTKSKNLDLDDALQHYLLTLI